jgi:nucleoid DNA-binding protein
MTSKPFATNSSRPRPHPSKPARGNLSRVEIVRTIRRQTAIPQKEIRAILELMLDGISSRLAAGGSVELRNFGIFRIKSRRARLGRNPKRPGSEIVIPAQAVIKFKAGKEVLQLLNQLPAETSA